ncbi:methyltransferase [Podospora aff. communis PSN243]|uniref:tRNA wybutosine-synthesizing protein 4 n=1 Tax=Podospora aff. communis PSN243 TaxID=3040156 RepID=A0AAV9H6E7_9PEZI|nr:methyltransferase [Podospora aff. communis PSN243]
MAQKKKPQPSPDGSTPPPTKSAQARAQDDQVMATNNSSIVSKRSVEKLYYPNEPHFFRFFVKKFQRRAPLINRGYHFRLHVIDVLVRNFLRALSKPGTNGKPKKKVVVNLGCGSDVLPWQCLTRYPESCVGVKFVDVDFPDLIERKRATVEATEELRGVFTGVKGRGEVEAPVVWESEEYVQIGCDLRELGTLRRGLERVVEVEECEFLFVAEVSITYMEREGADGVVKWAATLGDAEFVLLEQILPEEEEHPFAATMLSHFGKLNTQLKSVHTYPTLQSQLDRFSSREWNSVQAWTLWQAWADETFLSNEERRKLDEVEPFEEWEEFAIFGAHYCVIHAKTQPGDVRIAGTRDVKVHDSLRDALPSRKLTVQYDALPGQKGQRRFAAAMFLPKEDVIVNTMGLGTKSRLQSCDIYSRGAHTRGMELTFGDGGPTTRMCHTLTDLGGDCGILLAGGRAGPADVHKDCWIFNRSTTSWVKTHDLPTPLYRHSVTSLRQPGLVLLAGGRGVTTDLFGDFLLFTPESGWTTCEILGDLKPLAVCGALLASRGAVDGVEGHFHGVYAGGIREGLIARQVLTWELVISESKKPTIQFKIPVLDEFYRHTLERFGATAYWDGSSYNVVGGIIRDELLQRSLETLQLDDAKGELSIQRTKYLGINEDEFPPPPLLVGASTIPLSDGQFVVVGGGATCFSMGTFWNKGVYTFRPTNQPEDDDQTTVSITSWSHEKTIDIVPGERSAPLRRKPTVDGGSNAQVHVKTIPRIKLQSSEDFENLLRKGQPAVLEGLDLGACTSLWSLDYLASQIGPDRQVVIHDSHTQSMNFTSKNFKYTTTNFSDFTQRLKAASRLYLRALSSDKPSEKPASLSSDFPTISSDFALPSQLALVSKNLFSSVFRMSGPVNMWLHYDVMANVYCQISGSKRLILFPPSDVTHLSFAPGASSSSIDVFSTLANAPWELAQTSPQEATLSPGDVLFLPPLWLHTATPTSDVSIAVNVFFRDLDGGVYAAGRDVYGNRDIAAYEKGRLDVGKLVDSFKKVPSDIREFYLLRLAEELKGRARG